MTSLTLPSPAKLNLFLHITGRRADGYHNLQTVFQLLDYGDDLHFTPRSDDQILLHHHLADVPTEHNLIIKAAKLLKQYLQKGGASLQTPTDLTRFIHGVDITLDKRLPMGGGLGGGSSNAATTLLALNHLWKAQLPIETLATLGLRLGADVPVFVHGFSAWAEGIGEDLQAIELPEPWYLVIKPNCHVATAEIFSNQELTRDTAAITVAAFFEQGGHNDCESVVCQHYPEVKKALKWLNNHENAQLTGTGACVFARFATRSQAEAVRNNTPTEWECFIAKGINQSPLHHRLRDSL